MNGVFAANGDGKLHLVADWEQLYRGNADPWDQSGKRGNLAAYYERSRYRLCRPLKEIGAHGDGLEIGCGHGHALRMLRLNGPLIRWQGADISKAAVDEAARLYPAVPFRVLDIADDCGAEPEFDVIVLGECLWYLLDRFDAAMANCYALLRSNGLLVLSQGFLAEQRYGRDVADGFNGTVRLFLQRYPHFRLVHASLDEDPAMPLQHGIVAFRMNE